MMANDVTTLNFFFDNFFIFLCILKGEVVVVAAVLMENKKIEKKTRCLGPLMILQREGKKEKGKVKFFWKFFEGAHSNIEIVVC